MADTPVLEAASGQDAPPRKRRWPLILIICVLALAGAGAGGWFLFAGRAASAAQEPGAAQESQSPPIFVALDPPFVVNFEADELVRFLQVTVQVMSRDPATVELIRANDPIVRNDLLLLLGNQKYEVLATRAGKEKLRAEALATVRHVVEAAGGKPERVAAVYFTSFVMQ